MIVIQQFSDGNCFIAEGIQKGEWLGINPKRN